MRSLLAYIKVIFSSNWMKDVQKLSNQSYYSLKRAHMAISDIAMTAQRQQVVDFSSPFMNLGKRHSLRCATLEWNLYVLGIGLMVKKATIKDIPLFSFLDPFTQDVWAYTATLLLALSALFFLSYRCDIWMFQIISIFLNPILFYQISPQWMDQPSSMRTESRWTRNWMEFQKLRVAGPWIIVATGLRYLAQVN